MSIQLRDYQQKIVDAARAEFAKGRRSVLCVCATGGGKTVCFMDMASRCRGRVLVLVHRGELKQQHIREFERFGVPMDNIIVETVQTVYRRMNNYPNIKMVIADESHLFMARTFKAVIDHFSKLGAYTVGFSASPVRLDGSSMSDIFQSMVQGPQTKELIEKKRLCPYDYYAPLAVDVSNLKKRCGDYVISEVEALMEPAVYGRVIDEYMKLCPDKQAIVFCVSIKHSKRVAKQFRDAGISAEHVDGTVPQKAREAIMADFRSGDIRILTNVNLFSEGISVDGIGAVVMLRPTESLALCLQQWGRGLRYAEGKVCTILDCVGNYSRHGLPDDHREWSLEGGAKRRNETDENGDFFIRSCPECFLTFKTAPVCPYCGAVYPLHPREIKAHEEIELKRIEAEQTAAVEQKKKEARREQGRAQTFEELLALAKKRGYKNPAYWASTIMRSRR